MWQNTNQIAWLCTKTHLNLLSFTISPIHGPDSQQPIVTATEKRKSSTLMLLFFLSLCSKCLITITPTSVFSLLSSVFFVSIQFSFFQFLYLCPLPPSFTSSMCNLLCASIHRLMQGCSAATQNMHRLTQYVARNIFSQRGRMVSDWWAFYRHQPMGHSGLHLGIHLSGWSSSWSWNLFSKAPAYTQTHYQTSVFKLLAEDDKLMHIVFWEM